MSPVIEPNLCAKCGREYFTPYAFSWHQKVCKSVLKAPAETGPDRSPVLLAGASSAPKAAAA